MATETPQPAAMAGVNLRRIDSGAPLRWLARGWQDLRRHPAASLFYGACFAASGWLLYFVFTAAYPLFAGLTSGFLLLGPVLAIGLYDLSRREEAGLPPLLGPTLVAWRRNLANLGLFAAVIAVVMLIWARASMVIFALFFDGGLPTFGDVVRHVVTFAQPEFTLIYFGVGGFFAAFIYAIAVISVPLMLDRQVDAVSAGIASIRAVSLNTMPLALWALVIAVFGAIGFATFFVGLIVLIPLVGHGTWHAYRDLVEPAAPSG